MDFSQSNPVTLVVKAPNQRIADQTIECALGWTVKKLKEHLSSVYPNKPQEKEQKLIYSGKLLQDHLMLKDVLRQYGEETQHTVHLVCAPTSYAFNGHTENQSDRMANPAQSPAEGLRHRRQETTPVTPSPPTHIPQGFGDQTALWNQYMAQMGQQVPQTGAAQMGAAQMGAAHPAMSYLAYNPQQYMYMQQMYAQYMQQYMQYYQTAGESSPPATPQPNAPPLQNPPANQRNPQQPAANQNIRMNAQGGPVVDDDDDEFGQRDWLDWVYTFSRFGVLLSIVYFYSTLSRCIAVFLFFVLVYLYEKGFFSLRRRGEPIVVAPPLAAANPDEVPLPDQPQPADPALAPANQDEATPPLPEAEPATARETENNTENEAQEAEESSDATEDNSAPVQPVETRPGFLTVIWCFVTTFFTSLVPQPPPAVNAN